ncbi:SulP family inorganic anion transporter [Sphingomonas sp. ASV193]|uniref:SulP family inorganic anion transporter n=1 Tax=Sphingomonas sp. ASV193 TaxID=3144405 RepID=UPI0032E92C1C
MSPKLRDGEFGSDFRAGLTVAALLIPEGLAYSKIAGLTPSHGLIAALAGLSIYAFVGRSRDAVVSATSASAAAMAAAIGRFPTFPASEIALVVGTLAGLLLLTFGVAKLGLLASFVSRPVLRGFAFGLAIAIVTRQLPALLGLPASKGGFLAQLVTLAAQLGDIRPLNAAIGLGALAVILILRLLSPAIPGSAAVLALGIGIASLVNLSAHGITEVGRIDLAFVLPGLPHLDARLELSLLLAAAPIALIIFAESWGSIRALALLRGDPVSSNRELVALGLANLGSAALGGQAVGAGFSASSANASAGSTSRLAGGFAAGVLALLLLVATPLLARLPDPVLAAVVVAALVHALDPRPLIKLWQIERDFWIAVAAALGVLVSGVLWGLLGAVCLSVLAIVRRLATPQVVELGRLEDSDDFVELSRHADAHVQPGVLVLRPGEPLFFANVESIMMTSEARILTSEARLLVLSLEESDDLDSTAIETLGESARRLKQNGRELRLARVKDPVRDLLVKGGNATAHLAASATRSVGAACSFEFDEGTRYED